MLKYKNIKPINQELSYPINIADLVASRCSNGYRIFINEVFTGLFSSQTRESAIVLAQAAIRSAIKSTLELYDIDEKIISEVTADDVVYKFERVYVFRQPDRHRPEMVYATQIGFEEGTCPKYCGNITILMACDYKAVGPIKGLSRYEQ